MTRLAFLMSALAMALAACGGPATTTTSGVKVYKISAGDAGRIRQRALESVNSLRSASGAPPLQLSNALSSAAATHSRDMSVQNRPWHFGSDGSSPIDRARRAGYSGVFKGENISETYETELETLAAWMQEPATRAVILDPQSRDLGFAWYQESNGKIWWTLTTGAPFGV